MKAMVLAAGVGNRLRPLTDATPKALVEVGGVAMLERVLLRLKAAGVSAAVVNVHHLPEKIEAFLRAKRGLGLKIEVSREPELLETGGGLKKAGSFFDDGKPFFLHNVDVYSELDLTSLYRAHLERPALATLAVRSRESKRRLLFDGEGLLKGREGSGPPAPGLQALAFDGIQVVSPGLLGKLTESGAFSIADAYVRLAGAGEAIRAFRSDDSYWQDIGSAEKLEEARRRALKI